MSTPAPKWRKGTRSNTSGGDCVEVAELAGNIGLRDSKDPDGPQLAFTREAFRKLLDDVLETMR